MSTSLDSSRIYKTISSPVGELRLVSDGEGLSGIYFDGHKGEVAPKTPWKLAEDSWILIEAARQLDEYFQGIRQAFDLKLSLHGTDFQKRVWSALGAIPFGETTSYGEIAREVCTIKASRAVGGAVGKNPVSIVIPCHRVIGSNENLTGFAGGLGRKRLLLSHEGAAVARKNPQGAFALAGAGAGMGWENRQGNGEAGARRNDNAFRATPPAFGRSTRS